MTQSILLVEDHESFRHAVVRLLGSDFDVDQAGCCQDALRLLSERTYDVVLTDVHLPDGVGFEVMESLRRSQSASAVIVMSGHATLDRAVEAMRAGASDFLQKPFSREAVLDAIRRLDQRRHVDTVPPPSEADLTSWRHRYAPEILGQDPGLMRVFDILSRVAATDCSVLVTGETGTGKELVCRALHHASQRSANAFVAINCAAIPETLMESELFGHVKGAFTGASSNYTGRFETADTGTLFLDEIGEMPQALQAKLLRALQEGEVYPVGHNKPRKVDVRVVAATHRDIDELAERHLFREDLLYRLDVIRVELPPLRTRRGDIPELVRRFIAESAERRKRPTAGIDDDALALLTAYEWPGNVRQLRHTIERMVLLARGQTLTTADIPPRMLEGRSTGGPESISGDLLTLPADGIDLRDAVESLENTLILQALERSGWNKNQAAAMLHMKRTTLVEKLKKRGWTKKPDEAAS